MYPSVRRLFLVLLFGACSVPATADMMAPGAPLPTGEDAIGTQRWYALALQENSLRITPVTATTEAPWRNVQGKQAGRLLAGRSVKPTAEKTLKLPKGSLFAFRRRGDDGKDIPLPQGNFASALTPATLSGGWRASTVLDGKEWTISTEVRQQADGQPLHGSLTLLAQEAGRATRVLLPPASGMAFAQQRLLWLGDLDIDGQPDLLLERTLPTGDIEYVLVIGHDFKALHIDVDRTAQHFSSGMEPESDSITWFKGQAGSAPFKRWSGFTISDTLWLAKLPDDNAPSPTTIADRSYQLQGQTIRFSLVYQPRAADDQRGSSSSNTTWRGKVFIMAHFRGRTQVLMEAAQPDGNGFTLDFGMSGGRPAIVVHYQPHYNNSFQHHWIYDGVRFREVLVSHSQGC